MFAKRLLSINIQYDQDKDPCLQTQGNPNTKGAR